MPTLGMSELLVIFMILVLVFGASRLPALGEGLGRTVRNFKRGFSSDDKIEVKDSGDQTASAEEPAARPLASSPAGSNVAKPAKPTKLDASDAEIVDKG